MTPKIKELKAVLDMPEEGQKIWLVAKKIMKSSEGEKGEVVLEESLADLAFRLRDEVKLLTTKGGYSLWYKAKIAIYNYEFYQDRTQRGTDAFWEYDAKKIHFIIRALIAKELAKEKNG